MANELQFDVCPETGIGCVLVNKDAETLKIDLMPDEAADLMELVKSGDLDAAKALLVGVDSKAKETIDDACLEALAEEIG